MVADPIPNYYNHDLLFPILGEQTQEQQHHPSFTLIRHLSSVDMASIADDSESVSSLNESAWDIIDERSAASEDEGNSELSRIRTPMSEIPEPIYPEESLGGHDTSSESQYNHNRHAEFSHFRKDSSSDPPDTARPFTTAPLVQDELLEEQASYIKYRESDSQGEQDVSFVLTEFDRPERKKLITEHSLSDKDELAGTVRQRMSKDGLSTSGPFKVIYVGAAEMKESIVNKIASALASGPGFSPRDSLSSSRVTVVPISSFANDSSPDVVLIDSMGIDMNIEECKSAKQEKNNIILSMATKSKVQSSWDDTTSQAHLPEGYDRPDLAVFYVPSRESSSAKMTRSLAREFFTRHQIPMLLISYDTKWRKVSSLVDIDQRLPHLTIEAFQTETGKARILHRQAVDINTFVNIDSAQLSRSLALLNIQKSATSLIEDVSSKYLTETSFVPTLENVTHKSKPRLGTSSIFRIVLILFSISAMLLLRRNEIFQPAQRDSLAAKETAAPPVLQIMTTTLTKSSSLVITSTVTQTLLPSPSSTESVSKVPIAELLKDNLYQNKSDKFQIQVVGDSHVILRAPLWFLRSKSQPTLKISVQRSKQHVPHELSTLFTGVYAIKLPQEYAYGNLEITVSTSNRSKIPEVFQVELGNPWLKISGWQRAALAMKDHVAEDFFTARVGLLKAYSHTSTRVQYFFKDAIAKADSLMKEAEKVSLGSLASTLEHTDQLLTQTKSLTLSLTDRIRSAASSHNPVTFSSHHELLTKDLSSYSKKISDLVLAQAKNLGGAASGVLTLGQDIQTYRETHFVNEQKRLVQTWWSVFGVPKDLKAKFHQCKRGSLDGDKSGNGCRSCKAARKCRRQERQKSRHADSDDDDDDDEEDTSPRNFIKRRRQARVARKRNFEAAMDSTWDSDDGF